MNLPEIKHRTAWGASAVVKAVSNAKRGQATTLRVPDKEMRDAVSGLASEMAQKANVDPDYVLVRVSQKKLPPQTKGMKYG